MRKAIDNFDYRVVEYIGNNEVEAHLMKSTAQKRFQDRVGKAWVPKWALWNALAGSSDKIRSAVAEMRRAIMQTSCVLLFIDDFVG